MTSVVRPRLSLIAALDHNRLIGAGDALPWALPADLLYFRQQTAGKPILMGRRTHEAIGRALPHRRNIVISRDPDYQPCAGAERADSLESAIRLAGDVSEVMVIGGAQLYAAALPCADRLYLTLIDACFEGDTYFPPLPAGVWHPVSVTARPADAQNPQAFRFTVWERFTRVA